MTTHKCRVNETSWCNGVNRGTVTSKNHQGHRHSLSVY